MDQITQPMTVFKMFAPQVRTSRGAAGDGRLRIEGIASSTIMDSHGDQITERALRKAAKSAVGMTVFLNHEYKVPEDVFGSVEKAMVRKSGDVDPKTGKDIYDLHLGIIVLEANDRAQRTFSQLESKAKLGISIGAMVPDGGAVFSKEKGGRYIIDDLDLVEASVISLPANPRAWIDHVVKAFSGIWPESPKMLLKRADLLKEIDPEEENMADPVEELEGEAAPSELTPEDASAEGPESEADASEGLEKADEEPEITTAAIEVDFVSVWSSETSSDALSETVSDTPPTGVTITATAQTTGDLSAQEATPEDAGGPTDLEKGLKGDDQALVKSLSAQLQAARAENVELSKERDAALELAKAAVDGSRKLMDRLSTLPVGRKTTTDQYVDPTMQKAAVDLDTLGGIYDQEVLKVMKRSNPK